MPRLQTLEIGCGDTNDLRFDIRCDIQPHPGVNLVADMRDLKMIPNNSIAYIKTAATIEHISYDDQIIAFKEWYRILVPHGLIWATTPDAAWMKSARDNGDITEEWYQTLLRGGEKDQYDIHKGLLTPSLMDSLVSACGFKIVWGRNGNQSGGSLDYVLEAIK